MPVIEGARFRTGATAGVSGDTSGYGPFVKAGVPGSSDFAAVAEKGAIAIDTTNGIQYTNSGTKATPTWTKTGTQT